MKMNSTTLTIIISLVIIIGIAVILVLSPGSGLSTKGAELEPFAKCIADTGTKFYGAFWCSHCQAQKALFGAAAKSLPYIECSQPSGQGQLQICIDKEVQSYPTWEFPDGSRQVGEMSLEALAAKTSCPLPGAATSTPSTIGATSTASTSSSAVR